ncbi:hypothetical protein DCS_07582 [Drechmeria coniospora]|uniref:Luciferase domain-containing protein n=1 Tax=Drechmeria coniospora TaxID=98403 RepID=A0A151GEV0_DRECN|nr:hypothetical protein DCS_07582 [Drechmeria coniospora]KYK55619.1 hypothetical protein DCS_07582 [Drechmeria coniospora]
MSTTVAPTKTLATYKYELKGEPEQPHHHRPAPPYAFRQQAISVTLDGPAIFALALTLVLALHFLGSHITEILVGLVPVLALVRNDYQNFINLGPGGTPSTFAGYVRVSWLRLWAIRDPFSPPKPDPCRPPGRGILARQSLPYRAGPRPLVAGIAPQRQIDQHGARQCYLSLRRTMERLSWHSPAKFGTERSCLEKHGLALFVRHPLRTNCQGEVCHVHDSDHSMHMCLHPDDIREILCKGWGQRHPLARKHWLLQMPVSPDFVMVYAPRGKPDPDPAASLWLVLRAPPPRRRARNRIRTSPDLA